MTKNVLNVDLYLIHFGLHALDPKFIVLDVFRLHHESTDLSVPD